MRHMLSLKSYSADEIIDLIEDALSLRSLVARRGLLSAPMNKKIALIFEKPSTRTRASLEVAAHELGIFTSYFEAAQSHLGQKESYEDTAQVLSLYYDAIIYRGHEQAHIEKIASASRVPVINALTNEWHPMQSIADAMTMKEKIEKPFNQMKMAFMGDGHCNVCASLLLICAKLGIDCRIGAPKAYWPDEALWSLCEGFARESGARLLRSEDPREAVDGVDVIHTDVWVSMGEEKNAWQERLKVMKPYRVDAALMKASRNPQVGFMHCLPALHDAESLLAQAIIREHPEYADGIEVTNEVFQSEASWVMTQAHNRLHTTRAILYSSLG